MEANSAEEDQERKVTETEVAEDGMIPIGSRVRHVKHGEGHVIAQLKDGRLHVEFDLGETHNYSADKIHAKLMIINENEETGRDEDEEDSVGGFQIMFAIPNFLLQGLVLWLPLALYPPLASRLQQLHSMQGWPSSLKRVLPRNYLLEVPCLKFYSCFIVDSALFISLTFLSQPRYYSILGWRPWEIEDTLILCVPIHFFWYAAITINEWSQFVTSKAEVIAEFIEILSKLPCACGSVVKVLSGVSNFLVEFFTIDDSYADQRLESPTTIWIG